MCGTRARDAIDLAVNRNPDIILPESYVHKTGQGLKKSAAVFPPSVPVRKRSLERSLDVRKNYRKRKRSRSATAAATAAVAAAAAAEAAECEKSSMQKQSQRERECARTRISIWQRRISPVRLPVCALPP